MKSEEVEIQEAHGVSGLAVTAQVGYSAQQEASQKAPALRMPNHPAIADLPAKVKAAKSEGLLARVDPNLEKMAREGRMDAEAWLAANAPAVVAADQASTGLAACRCLHPTQPSVDGANVRLGPGLGPPGASPASASRTS